MKKSQSWTVDELHTHTRAHTQSELEIKRMSEERSRAEERQRYTLHLLNDSHIEMVIVWSRHWNMTSCWNENMRSVCMFLWYQTVRMMWCNLVITHYNNDGLCSVWGVWPLENTTGTVWWRRLSREPSSHDRRGRGRCRWWPEHEPEDYISHLMSNVNTSLHIIILFRREHNKTVSDEEERKTVKHFFFNMAYTDKSLEISSLSWLCLNNIFLYCFKFSISSYNVSFVFYTFHSSPTFFPSPYMSGNFRSSSWTVL